MPATRARTSREETTDGAAPAEELLHENDVVLVGRLAAEPVARALPSGTEICTFRIVVLRAPTAMTRGSRQKSDWMDCTAWTAGVRRRVATWRPGDVVRVEGSVRRRHYRGEAGGGSRVEIEAIGVRLVRRSAPGPAARDPA